MPISQTEYLTPIDPNQMLVTRAQTCAMLGNISVSTLRRYIKAGALHPVFINSSLRPRRNGKMFFNIDEVRNFIARHTPAAAMFPQAVDSEHA
jgi:hypothetical protein